MQIALVLGLPGVTIALFATEKRSVDAVTLVLVIVLTLTVPNNSTCTLTGTSTHVAVSGYSTQAGMQPVGLFEPLPTGLLGHWTRKGPRPVDQRLPTIDQCTNDY